MIDPHPLSMLPFAAMLFCIAFLPFILKHHWERFYHLIAITLAAITVGYYAIALRHPERIALEAADYIGFIALVGSLFVVAGGIHVEITAKASPLFNCAFLAIGGILGNLIGTTGASLLLIRPWIRVNRYRYSAWHTAFFIFVVSNVGGGLLPMGPPLFLGYLIGVPFWWVATHCLEPWLIAILGLLIVFYFVDRRNYSERPREAAPPTAGPKRVHVTGIRNVWFIGVILVAVFIDQPPFLREALMVGAALASYFTTPKSLHVANDFSFGPLREVAWLFFGIFFTMIPVLDFMHLHARELSIDSPMKFYWVAGGLSSVLDNAPTYLTFLSNALGRLNLSVESPADVHQFLTTAGAREAAAISMGAVFFGAATYIGNSPNFMIKAIVEQQKLPSPGFFGFILRYSLPVVLPIVSLVAFLCFRN